MPAADEKIAHYADALLSLGQAHGDLPQLTADISAALAFLAEHPDIRSFLADSAVQAEGKEAALRELLAGRIGLLALHVLLLLQDEGQFTALGQIAECFFEKTAMLDDKISGELTSAVPLSEERVAKIEKEAGRLLNRDLNLHALVDPSILGGIRLKVGDFVLDGTVDRQLSDARERLLSL